jgi:alkylation response protein AidB-like acyl-CoA dehydrogenase
MVLDTIADSDTARCADGDSVGLRTAELTQVFARRAEEYDRTGAFPRADFDDLFAAGLNAPTIPVDYGGLGLGPFRRRAHPRAMIRTCGWPRCGELKGAPSRG